MNSDDRVLYLANTIFISAADGKLTDEEGAAIERIRQEIGAGEEQLKQALEAVAMGKHRPEPVGRFSDRVRNFEDMVFVSLADGEMSKAEKPELLSFAKQIKVTQTQITDILAQAKKRSTVPGAGRGCTSCDKEIPGNSKFCPFCGESV
ncbi:hypothetical protein ACFL4N_06915 [Thermodesulfobacteriota bacterium]